MINRQLPPLIPGKRTALISDGDELAWSESGLSNTDASITVETNLSSNSTTAAPSVSAVVTGLADKVDKVAGKGLSTNDYTTSEKNRLASMRTPTDEGSKPLSLWRTEEVPLYSGNLYTLLQNNTLGGDTLKIATTEYTINAGTPALELTNLIILGQYGRLFTDREVVMSGSTVYDLNLTGAAWLTKLTLSNTNTLSGGSLLGGILAAGSVTTLINQTAFPTFTVQAGTKPTVILRGTTPDPTTAQLLGGAFTLVDERGNSSVSATYAELEALVTDFKLRPGRQYLMTDFQSIQTVGGATTLICENGVVLTGVTTSTYPGPNPAVNGSEPLLLTAISTSKFAPTAYSPAYPQDEIDYDFTKAIVGNGKYNKGTILRRRDAKYNVECFYDFRTVKVRRWKALGVGGTSVGTATLDGTTLLINGDKEPADSYGGARYISIVANTSGVSPTTITYANGVVPIQNAVVLTEPVTPAKITTYRMFDNSIVYLLTPLLYLSDEIANKYVARTSSANQLLGNSTPIKVDSNSYMDSLTFATPTAATNVYLGKGSTNVTFTSLVTNVTIPRAINSTFIGGTYNFTCAGGAINNVIFTNRVDEVFFLKGASDSLIATPFNSSFRVQGTFLRNTLSMFSDCHTLGAFSDSTIMPDSTGTIYGVQFGSTVSDLTVYGYLEDVVFRSSINNSFVGNNEGTGSVLVTSSINGTLGSSILILNALSITWDVPMSRAIFRGYVPLLFRVSLSGSYGKFYIIQINENSLTPQYSLLTNEVRQ